MDEGLKEFHDLNLLIGERLSELRTFEGLTQDQLAEILGIEHNTISSYEHGKIRPADPIKILIAKHFNVSIDYLLGLVRENVSYKHDNASIALPTEKTDEIRTEMLNFLDYLKHKYHVK